MQIWRFSMKHVWSEPSLIDMMIFFFFSGGHPRRFELKTLKWIDRVWRFDGFPWNLVRTFTDIDVEQNPVGEFLYVKYFPRGGLLRNRLREFFISRTWQIYKKITNRNKRKCRHGFGDLGFVINAAHLLYMNRILCPINSLEYQSVISELTALCHLWKAKSKTKHNCIEFYILYPLRSYIVCGGFLENSACTYTRRFEVTSWWLRRTFDLKLNLLSEIS